MELTLAKSQGYLRNQLHQSGSSSSKKLLAVIGVYTGFGSRLRRNVFRGSWMPANLICLFILKFLCLLMTCTLKSHLSPLDFVELNSKGITAAYMLPILKQYISAFFTNLMCLILTRACEISKFRNRKLIILQYSKSSKMVLVNQAHKKSKIPFFFFFVFQVFRNDLH